MIFAFVCLALGGVGIWLSYTAMNDYRKGEGNFSDWIVSDATPLNRRLWRALHLFQIPMFFLVGIVMFAVFVKLLFLD